MWHTKIRVQEVLEFESSDTSYTNDPCYDIIKKSSAKLFAATFWLHLRFALLPRVLEFYQNFYDLNQLFFLLLFGKTYEYNFRHNFSLQDAKYKHSLTNRRHFTFAIKRDNNRKPTDKGSIHARNNFQFFLLKRVNILMRNLNSPGDCNSYDLSIIFFWLFLSEQCLHMALAKPEHTNQLLVMWHCILTA